MHIATPPAPCPPSTAHLALPFFDDVTTVIQGGSSSVKALTGSTEEEQFH